MKNISYIEFVFENCEEARVYAKHIGKLVITDIRDEIGRVACNAICKVRTANEVAVEIFSEANQRLASFDPNTDKSIFDRILEWNDITHINVVYEDGKEEYICVNYDEGLDEGKLGAQNILQTSKLSDFNNLYVVISTSGEDIDTLFPDSEINDKDAVLLDKRIYGITKDEAHE